MRSNTPTNTHPLEKKYSDVLLRMKTAIESRGRDLSELELMAVSKKHSALQVEKLYGLGHRYFGENYASELFEKAATLAELDIRWSFIGTLQSNKISRLVAVCSEIQTAASLKHLKHIDKSAGELRKFGFPVYLQINLTKEPQKSGFTLEDLEANIAQIKKDFPNLTFEGLMAIPPAEVSQDTENPKSQQFYKRLKNINDGFGFKKLSLGMSHDMELAIENGSTCIRVGTDIFGPRPL